MGVTREPSQMLEWGKMAQEYSKGVESWRPSAEILNEVGYRKSDFPAKTVTFDSDK